MKTRYLAAAATSFLLAHSAFAETGSIQFNGALTDTTCTVSGQVSGVNSVNLPTLSTSALAALGKTAGATSFQLTVSGCTGTVAPTSVATYFEGAVGKPNAADGRIPTDNPTVDLQLLDETGTNALNLTQTTTAANFSGGSATQKFVVRYYSLSANPNSGSTKAAVTYSLVYN